MIVLHLVSWNRPKMTELVLKTIKRNTKPGTYYVAVLDNGSNRETTQMLARLHGEGYIDELHMMDVNAGLEKARQWLLLNCTYEDTQYFVCVDNDCLPSPIKYDKDWLERLVELMHKYEDFAAISCRTQVMIGTGNIFEEADIVGDDIVEFPHPGGSYRIMRASAARIVGGWDREEPGRGSEEKYICGKLREAGYRTAFAVDVRSLHLFGTRGENTTDPWGYDKNLKPQDTGHSEISHPALTNGDDIEEILLFAGEQDAYSYYQG